MKKKISALDIREIISGRRSTKGCPQDYSAGENRCSLTCTECWEQELSDKYIKRHMLNAVKILHTLCNTFESCEECPLDGKCIMFDPTTWDMSKYEDDEVE